MRRAPPLMRARRRSADAIRMATGDGTGKWSDPRFELFVEHASELVLEITADEVIDHHA